MDICTYISDTHILSDFKCDESRPLVVMRQYEDKFMCKIAFPKGARKITFICRRGTGVIFNPCSDRVYTPETVTWFKGG